LLPASVHGQTPPGFIYSILWEFSALVDSLNILQFDGIIGTLKQAQVYFNAYVSEIMKIRMEGQVELFNWVD
jgi:hypothetical protein